MKIKIGTIQWLLTCFILLWLNAGNFEYIQAYFPQVVKLALVAVWFLFTQQLYKRFLSLYIRRAWPVLFLLGLMFLSKMLGNDRYYRLYWMNYMYYAILFAIFICCYCCYSNEKNKALLMVVTADISVMAVHTFVELLRNPMLVRAMSTSMNVKYELLGGLIPTGVGGYGMCYQLVFLAMLLAMCLEKYPYYRIWIYFAEVFIFTLLFRAQITLALLLQVVGIFSVLWFKRGTKGFIWKFSLVTIFALLIVNLNAVLEFLIPIAGDELGERLQELLRIQEINMDSSGDLASRYRLYWKSFSLFISNPLWGDFGGENIGCHSSFIDLLGAFGILGVFGMVGIMKPLHLTIRDTQHTEKTKTVLCYAMMFVLSIINVSISSDILVVTTVMAPLFFKIMYGKERIL